MLDALMWSVLVQGVDDV